MIIVLKERSKVIAKVLLVLFILGILLFVLWLIELLPF